MKRTQTQDANMQTSSSSVLQLVRNKNNLADMLLRRRVDEYRKECLSKVYDIEMERLDWKIFLGNLKACNSDDMSEFAT